MLRLKRIALKSLSVTYSNKMETLGKTKKKWIQNDFVKLIRSFLAYDSGGGTRPLFNNEVGHESLKNISYSRGGALPDFKTTMSYKGVDVIEVNTTRNIPSRTLNQNTQQGKEFVSLIKKPFIQTNKIIEESSKETNNQNKPSGILSTITNTPRTQNSQINK